ncbi:PREDICTED: 5-hydroxytryptamine receptor 1D-like [Priapulus caudatus]|uniref:5-hydroxytryptamine receptor 1D-like n=1 Tax=Priapulus caudatus TaxID=37621 RepID=A0ABM1DWC2_PRICU|nr:PREDICTED: 5-hydroxytryptamine receptor 1D-like [Priapulus caudatus]
MTTASIFTMLAISMDRLWSVTWSVHYRNNNTTRKTIAIISVVWLLDVILILPAMIVDRVREHPKWSDPTLPGFRYDCIWDPARNVVFVYSVMFICYQVPLVLMIVCYFRVYYVMKKRARVSGARGAMFNQHTSHSVTGVATVATVARKEPPNEKPSIPAPVSAAVAVSTLNVENASTSTQPRVLVPAATATRRAGSRRAFITLTYILVSFLFCWGSFFVMFDMKAADPNSISDTTYTLLFWLPYFNSTLNPVLYGIGNPEFRKAFRMILQRK